MAYDGELKTGDTVVAWITGMVGDFTCEITEECKLHGWHLKVLSPANSVMTGVTLKGDDFIIREKINT